MFTIYHIHPVTNEILGSQEYDPPEGVGLPAHSTDIAPPETGSHQTAIFRGDTWQVVPDHRGKSVYNKFTRASSVVEKIGPLPDEVTDLSPSTDFDVWNGTEWVTDTSEQNRTDILIQISTIETQITPRRIREAIISGDNGFIEDMENKIIELRKKL